MGGWVDGIELSSPAVVRLPSFSPAAIVIGPIPAICRDSFPPLGGHPQYC